jgi:hypothetical protein
LPFVGRGSARIISDPINARKINGSDYLGIDLGRKASFLKKPRTGMMSLFGNNVELDMRKMVVFARDISYLNPEYYSAIQRPSRLEEFPASLTNPGLEYSGIFEDGWISETAYVILRSPQGIEPLLFHFVGSIPNIDDSTFITTIKLSINGNQIYNAQHTVGKLDLTIPISNKYLKLGDQAVIKVESSSLQRLPNGDGRPVSLHLERLGF